MANDERCRHCQYLSPSHADTCPTQPLEVQVAGLKAQIKLWQDHTERKDRAIASINSIARLWEGKYHQVKRENNALRRQLWHRKSKVKADEP